MQITKIPSNDFDYFKDIFAQELNQEWGSWNTHHRDQLSHAALTNVTIEMTRAQAKCKPTLISHRLVNY